MKTLTITSTIFAIALTLCSCTKSITLRSGDRSKKILVSGNIKFVNDTINFKSINGTKYHISAALYDYIIE